VKISFQRGRCYCGIKRRIHLGAGREKGRKKGTEDWSVVPSADHYAGYLAVPSRLEKRQGRTKFAPKRLVRTEKKGSEIQGWQGGRDGVQKHPQ